jgi:hypothetical protein
MCYQRKKVKVQQQRVLEEVAMHLHSLLLAHGQDDTTTNSAAARKPKKKGNSKRRVKEELELSSTTDESKVMSDSSEEEEDEESELFALRKSKHKPFSRQTLREAAAATTSPHAASSTNADSNDSRALRKQQLKEKRLARKQRAQHPPSVFLILKPTPLHGVSSVSSCELRRVCSLSHARRVAA